ncbi:MAG: PH domain-containing protein [Phycisphaerales bacterium]|nr:PH domain-containing protein [Phycisphaerales bacterium]
MQRFNVEAVDSSGKSVRRTVQAGSIGDVERLLASEGLTVRAVAADTSTDQNPDTPTVKPAGPEEVVWSGTPSQWLNFWWYLSCVILIPIAIWKFIELRSTAFTLTTQRIKLESGVLSKAYDQVELYRVKDTVLTRTLLQRMLGLGSIKMITSDPSQPELVFPSISDSENVREMIRQNVERMRRLRGVRELDVADEMLPHSHG